MAQRRVSILKKWEEIEPMYHHKGKSNPRQKKKKKTQSEEEEEDESRMNYSSLSTG